MRGGDGHQDERTAGGTNDSNGEGGLRHSRNRPKRRLSSFGPQVLLMLQEHNDPCPIIYHHRCEPLLVGWVVRWDKEQHDHDGEDGNDENTDGMRTTTAATATTVGADGNDKNHYHHGNDRDNGGGEQRHGPSRPRGRKNEGQGMAGPSFTKNARDVFLVSIH